MSTPPPTRAWHPKFTLIFWLVSAVLVIWSVAGFVTAGFGGLLMIWGLFAFITGSYSLVTGRLGWASIPGRKVAAVVLAASLVATVAGAVASPRTSRDSTPVASKHQSTSVQAADKPSPTPTPSYGSTDESPDDPAIVAVPDLAPSVAVADSSVTDTTAVALLGTLPIKGKSPLTGYARTAMFGTAWLDVDRNGCDTRNDILQRDLTGITLSGRCKVMSGHLLSPYTGQDVDFVRGNTTSLAVQIDHVVALANAWQTGAQKLSQAQRVALANDPINLFAVDGRSNSQKGAGDTATWLPSAKAFRCTYVGHQVSVKATYGLWVTQAEHDAMTRVLDGCQGQRAVSSSFAPAPVVVPVPVAAPVPVAPAPVPVAAPAPAPAPAGCDPNYSGQCVPIASDVDCAGGGGNGPAYTKGPVRIIGTDIYKLDRDGDGIACD
jgi:hypothetical protein